MSCSNKNVQDIESIYSKHDDQFKTINSKNIDKYNKLVTILFQFYISNKENIKPNSDFKEKFNKLYGKLQKRGDIIVKKSFIVYIYQKLVKENILPNDPQFWLYIQKSPARNVSGVNSFALLLSPHPNGQAFSCKHNCYYCPDESRKNGAEDDMPRSYLKNEPAVARGFQNGWDPYNQMMNRMNSLLMQGHEVDKLELIIEGGTYTEFPKSYLETFHRDIFYSANTFYDIEPKRQPLELEEEIFINKTTKVRIIGICIETRPDAIDDEWIKFFRNTGTTRIQLGVQHTNNKLLKKINRGHTFEQAVECIKYLKNNCFKVDIHLMPDLPGSTPELDKEMFDIVYNSPIIQPDQTKIYPCEVVPWTVIKQWHESGKYTPYSDSNPKSLVDVITYAMTICPPWVRIPRIVRDIPLTYISGGNTCMNMRQVIDDGLKKSEKLSGDIRSREIGRHLEYNIFDSRYIVRKYEGSESTEYFISLESSDKKVIFGFLRLRIPPKNHDPVYSSIKNTGLVRELHVYNNIVPVGENKKISTQHLGTGKTLVKLAEYISWFYGLEGVSVITGEGVREYYHKRGYESIQSYAVKKFKYKLWKFWLLIYFIQFLSLPFNFSLK
jgi:ELP3 family radical SAM enzyme/protein acetyltransferase